MKKISVLFISLVLILISALSVCAADLSYAYDEGIYVDDVVEVSADGQRAIFDGKEYVFLDVGNFAGVSEEHYPADVIYKDGTKNGRGYAKFYTGKHDYLEITYEEQFGYSTTVTTNTYYVEKDYYNEARAVAVGEGDHFAMASYYSDHFGNLSTEAVAKVVSAVPSMINYTNGCKISNAMELYSTDKTNSFYSLYGKVISLYDYENNIDLGNYILLYSDCNLSQMTNYGTGYEVENMREAKLYPVTDVELNKIINETIDYTPDDGLDGLVYQGASDTFTKASTIVILGIVPFIIGLLCLIFGIKKWKGVYKKVAFIISGCMLVEIVCYIIIFANIGF